MTLVHWDDVQKRQMTRPGLGGRWSGLGPAAGALRVGLNRIELGPGEVSTPAHAHSGDEEVFFVLTGSGRSWQDGETYEIRAGDCLVHHGRGAAHTLRAGNDGLDVLAWGTRTATGGVHLPRVGAYWLKAPDAWIDVNPGDNPFDRNPALDWPEPSPRPESIVNLDDVESMYGGRAKRLAGGAGAKQSGLNWVSLEPGGAGAPPHCHSAEEELFVVLDGEGMLELWSPPQPGAPNPTEPNETFPVQRGHVVSRPAATRIPHSFRGGEGGLTYLAYGTREPNDICWYPRSNKVFFRGLGVIARLELLEYSDGEPD
ncbi:MAG: cupin domain-containing protein [Gaiellaceae bacterium]